MSNTAGKHYDDMASTPQGEAKSSTSSPCVQHEAQLTPCWHIRYKVSALSVSNTVGKHDAAGMP